MPFTLPVSITVPAPTLEVNAVRANVVLPARSVIDSVKLHVPAGVQATAPVWVELDGAQVIPDAQQGDGEIRLDNVSALELLAAPMAVPRTARLSLVGYNDGVNPHTTRLLVLGRYRTEVPDAEARRLGL